LANVQSTLQNNGIASIIRDEEDGEIEIGPCPNEEQQLEISHQIVESKPYYTVNPLDELNEKIGRWIWPNRRKCLR
jgi:hypothetical protein